jgi:hypothetical protein
MADAGDSNSIFSIKKIRFPARIVSQQLEVALFRTLRGHEPQENVKWKQDQKLKHACLYLFIRADSYTTCRTM